MPWVKDFDVEAAVDCAMKVFWAKGYEATSISDLTEAMHINTGSLYNAFGSKQALFTRTLLKYDRETRQVPFEQLEAMDDPVAAIQTLFNAVVAKCQADKERKGCLLINTALDLPNQSEDVQRLVTSALQEFEDFFERALRLAQDRDEIFANLDPREVAKLLLSQIVGLQVLSRSVFDSESLKAIGSQALEQIEANLTTKKKNLRARQ